MHPCESLCTVGPFAMSYICIVNDKQDGCAADGGDERRLSELPFLAMFYTSMSGTRLHVYYRYLVPNEGLSPEVTNARLRRGADTADSIYINIYTIYKKNIYHFFYYRYCKSLIFCCQQCQHLFADAH